MKWWLCIVYWCSVGDVVALMLCGYVIVWRCGGVVK